MVNRWYVIQTKSNQEQIAIKEIRKQGFEVYYPTFTETYTNRKGDVSSRIVALFPSYMFVSFDIARDRWRSLVSTRGVSAMIGCGDTFVSPLPEGCIEEIMSRSIDGNTPVQVLEDTIMKINEGNSVKINEGSFAGHVGTVCSTGSGRITVLLALLNSQIRVVLKDKSVTPCEG